MSDSSEMGPERNVFEGESSAMGASVRDNQADTLTAAFRIRSVLKAICPSIMPLPERNTRLHLDMARGRAVPSFGNQSSPRQNSRTSMRKAAAVVHQRTSYLLDLSLKLLSQAVHCSCVLPTSRLRSTTLKDTGFEGNCAAKLARNSVNECAPNYGSTTAVWKLC